MKFLHKFKNGKKEKVNPIKKEKSQIMEKDEKIIYKQIIEYHEFQEKIKTFFLTGRNPSGNGHKETWYFIEDTWIKNWKNITNYNEVINNRDKGYDYLINNNILKKNNLYTLKGLNIRKSSENFLRKSYYEIKDFECLVNKSIYDLFLKLKLSDILFFRYKLDTKTIEAIFYDKIFFLLINEEKRIIIFFYDEIHKDIQENFGLIQLNIDFIEDKDNQFKCDVEVVDCNIIDDFKIEENKNNLGNLFLKGIPTKKINKASEIINKIFSQI